MVQGPAIADRSSLEEFARSRALPGGLLAALAHDQALPLAVDAAVWPDSREVGDVAPGFHPQELPGALHRDLHLGAALDRDHAAYHHFSGLLTDLFAQHGSLLSVFDPASPDRLSRSRTQRTTLRGGVRLVDGGSLAQAPAPTSHAVMRLPSCPGQLATSAEPSREQWGVSWAQTDERRCGS